MTNDPQVVALLLQRLIELTEAAQLNPQPTPALRQALAGARDAMRLALGLPHIERVE